MRKKLLSVVLTIGMVTTPLIGHADSFDDQIAQKQQQLQKLEKSKIEQSSQLKTLIDEQNQLSNQISSLVVEMEKTQQEMSHLVEEINTLDTVIEKRRHNIENQARVLQVTDSVNMYFEAIFKSQSISEAISRIFMMSEIIGHSVDVLEQQNRDISKLHDKKVAIQEKADKQERNIASLHTAKEQLASKVVAANQELINLELAQSTAKEDIERLNAEKEEAIRLAQEQARRAEEQRLAEQRAREQQLALEKAAKERVAQQAQVQASSSVSSSNTLSSTTTVSRQPGLFSYPVSGASVSSPFGERHLTFGGITTTRHDGVDFVNGNPQSPIYAAGSGTVVSAGWLSGAIGNGVIIKHSNGYYTYYYHMSSVSVSVGTVVSVGQQIGIMGSTGRSTGAHLHFGVSTGYFSGFIDPMGVL